MQSKNPTRRIALADFLDAALALEFASTPAERREALYRYIAACLELWPEPTA